MRAMMLLFAAAVVGHLASVARAADPYTEGDPWWILIHEPSVVDELSLSSDQRQDYLESIDALDLRFFPLRNKSRDEALAGLATIIADAKHELANLLQPEQSRRLQQILLWRLGTSSLLREDVAERLRLDEVQRKRTEDVLSESEKSVAAIQKKLAEGGSREALEKEFRERKLVEQRQILQVLKPEQQRAFKDLLGEPFDITKLGQPAFKVPELIDTGEWINSPPVSLEQLRGKVVVLHYYACGCINCIHNYPTYLEWQDEFEGKDVALIGIHTPETATERSSEHVRRKAKEANFKFPVLIDGKSENWNAWGNSMWPSVYVIDKRGYLRVFWPGELKWKGATGDEYVKERVEYLLKENVSTSPVADRGSLP